MNSKTPCSSNWLSIRLWTCRCSRKSSRGNSCSAARARPRGVLQSHLCRDLSTAGVMDEGMPFPLIAHVTPCHYGDRPCWSGANTCSRGTKSTPRAQPDADGCRRGVCRCRLSLAIRSCPCGHGVQIRRGVEPCDWADDYLITCPNVRDTMKKECEPHTFYD